MTLRVTSPGLRRALAKGLTVRLSGATPGTHAVVATAGRRVVGSGTAKVGRDGTGRLVLRFSKAGRKALRGKARATLVLKGAGATRTLTLRR